MPMMERRIQEQGKSAKWGGIQPMNQERSYGGGMQGRVSITCAPDSCGIHSLIGVLTPRGSVGTVLVGQKGRFLFLCPRTF